MLWSIENMIVQNNMKLQFMPTIAQEWAELTS